MLEAAMAHFQEGLELTQRLGPGLPQVRCLAGLAGVASLEGDWSRAARLFGAASAQAEAASTLLGPADRSLLDSRVAAVRNALGNAAFHAHWNAGRALPAALAIAEALSRASALQPRRTAC